ncbi:unnamed protein product [Adineta ricciae]|uniref:Uncharacterized protein n=1 Tax=Adineta ricciae TaxID=249248 RepID=A0A815URZ5_ADIRI|nr:unnamed protein product [Adineta ricciae]CAF1668587.1 unnamed protein product [Adineta ricciae]
MALTIDNFKSVRTIMDFKSRSQLLHDFNRQRFLLESLKKNISESSHYYCEWFSCFIMNDTYSMNVDQQRQDYEQLVKEWTSCVERDIHIFGAVLKELDKLIESLQSMTNNDDGNKCCEIFINHLVDICCKTDSIFQLLQSGLVHVKNKSFIDAFKTKFIGKILKDMKADDLKRFDFYQNQLRQLFEIGNNDKENNQLVIDLIERALTNVSISENDILEYTILKPDRSTLIYHILSHNCYKKLSIFEIVIKQMDTLWTQWDQQGIYERHILAWKKQTDEQRSVANQLWSAVKNKVGTFEEMLMKADTDLENKKSICEKTEVCIKVYCEKAYDNQKIIGEIHITKDELRKNKVQSVQISQSIQQIHNYVDLLVPYAKCQIWKDFLQKNQDKTILPS